MCRLPTQMKDSKMMMPKHGPSVVDQPGPSKQRLPDDFVPCQFTVVIGKTKEARDALGTKFLRENIQKHLPAYRSAETKAEKSRIVTRIFDEQQRRCTSGFPFAKKTENGEWWGLSDIDARENITATFRNRLSDRYTSSSKFKSALRREQGIGTTTKSKEKKKPSGTASNANGTTETKKEIEEHLSDSSSTLPSTAQRPIHPDSNAYLRKFRPTRDLRESHLVDASCDVRYGDATVESHGAPGWDNAIDTGLREHPPRYQPEAQLIAASNAVGYGDSTTATSSLSNGAASWANAMNVGVDYYSWTSMIPSNDGRQLAGSPSFFAREFPTQGSNMQPPAEGCDAYPTILTRYDSIFGDHATGHIENGNTTTVPQHSRGNSRHGDGDGDHSSSPPGPPATLLEPVDPSIFDK